MSSLSLIRARLHTPADPVAIKLSIAFARMYLPPDNLASYLLKAILVEMAIKIETATAPK